MNCSRIMSLTIAAVSIAACSGDSAKTDSSALKSDSAMQASLAMANADSGKKVQLGDTATGTPAKTPVTKKPTPAPTPTKTNTAPVQAPPPKPAPTPAPAAPKTGTIAAGTMVTLTSNQKICTNTNAVGDNVYGETAESISGSNGAAIPAGAVVHLTVTNLKRSENANDKIVMEFRVNSVSWGGKSYNVEASIESAEVTKIRDQPQSKDVQKVAVGAAAGAIAGKILGKSTKATVIGGAAGAAAGAAVAVGTANYQGCINQGAKIVVKLDGPLTLNVGF